MRRFGLTMQSSQIPTAVLTCNFNVAVVSRHRFYTERVCMINEEWYDIKGFEGIYQITKSGRIRSIARSWQQKARSGCVHTHSIKGRELKPGLSAQGYPTVVLGRKTGTRTVHSLVAETFIGPRPCNNEVRHKNGDRTDHRLDNLCYGTRSDNINDSRTHGTFAQRYESIRHLRTKDIFKVRELYATGEYTRRRLSEMFCAPTACISRAIRGEYKCE